MSKHAKATVELWQRDERGEYKAEKNGWTLRVRWRPEDERGHRGFLWTAERAGTRLKAEEIHEEIEDAMAEAERVAA